MVSWWVLIHYGSLEEMSLNYQNWIAWERRKNPHRIVLTLKVFMYLNMNCNQWGNFSRKFVYKFLDSIGKYPKKFYSHCWQINLSTPHNSFLFIPLNFTRKLSKYLWSRALCSPCPINHSPYTWVFLQAFVFLI